jgi:hypothetical protein
MTDVGEAFWVGVMSGGLMIMLSLVILVILPALIANGTIESDGNILREDMQVNYVEQKACVINLDSESTRDIVLERARWCADLLEKNNQ